MTEEARIYNGEKMASLISGGRKTGQVRVEEWDYNISSQIYEK